MSHIEIYEYNNASISRERRREKKVYFFHGFLKGMNSMQDSYQSNHLTLLIVHGKMYKPFILHDLDPNKNPNFLFIAEL